MPPNRPDFPFYLSLNVTTRCNLNCRYCYMRPHSGRDMTMPAFNSIIEQAARQRIFYLVLSGGEPFLHPRIDEMITTACRRVHEVSVVTNGSQIAAHSDYLKGLAFDNLHIQVSIDSCEEAVNKKLRGISYRDSLDAIRRLGDSRVHLSAGVVVTRLNISTVCATIRDLSRYLSYFNIMILQNTVADRGLTRTLGITEEEAESLWEEITEIRKETGLRITIPGDIEGTDSCTASGALCAACFTYLTVDPDLRVRPCDRVTDRFIGDLNEKSLAEIWQSPEALGVTARSRPLCLAFK